MKIPRLIMVSKIIKSSEFRRAMFLSRLMGALPNCRQPVPIGDRDGPLVRWRCLLRYVITIVIIASKGETSMLKTSVRRVGNSLGVTLPRTIIENYHLSEGDELHLLEMKDGIVLTPFDPKFAQWAASFERLNRRYRNTLKALAK
jgi:putative addiction module antidote